MCLSVPGTLSGTADTAPFPILDAEITQNQVKLAKSVVFTQLIYSDLT